MDITRLILPDLEEALAESPESVREAIAELHAADVAELLRGLSNEQQARLLPLLPEDSVAEVVDYLGPGHRAPVFALLPGELQVRIASHMSADDRADMFAMLEPEVRDAVLAQLPKEEARDVRTLMSYPPATAGGLMTTDVVVIPADLTVGEVLERIRILAQQAESVTYAYLSDRASGKLVGVLSLRELVLNRAERKASEVMNPDVVTVQPLTDQEEVAKLIAKYDFTAVPVVDEQGRLLGIITVDDLVDVVVQEGTEDIHKLGGLETLDAPYLDVGFASMLRKRGGWLSVLFLGELLTASAMGYYEDEIKKAVILAMFVPLIISSGGNSGSQATTLVIRAMALGEVKLADWWRVVRREFMAGLALGTVLGVIGVVRIALWQSMFGVYGEHWLLVGITVGVSLANVVLWGTLAGSMLPFLMRRVGFDPASASAPFVATLVDVSGLLIYFSVANFVLHGALL